MAQLNWKPSYDGSALRWRPSYLPEELPEAPSGTVTIGAITPTSSGASVAITYDGDDATGFEYRIDGGSAVSGGSASPIVVSGLSASTEYDLEIRPTNDGGEGAWSAVATFETRMANPGDRATIVRKLSIVASAVEELMFSGVPSPIQIAQGGSVDLSQYVSGGVPPYSGYAVDSGTLPSGVTLSSAGLLEATEEASVGESGDITFGVDDSAGGAEPGALSVEFGLLSSVGGSDLPFAFGHVFAEGDVPSGNYVSADLTDWQATPTTYWPDGSVRHAIIAGRATCTKDVKKVVTLGTTTSAPSGTALTESDLLAALTAGHNTLTDGSQTIDIRSLVGTAAKHRTVCAGPVMSNWLYRQPITGSDHLVAWFDVRLYKGGAVEIFPWIENGYLLVANPTNDVRTWTLKIGNVQMFSAELDIKHHTRIPLLDNTASSFKHWSYWTGSDPQIEPAVDHGYLMASKMVPNYGWTPKESARAGTELYCEFTQAFAPNWLGDTDETMANAGFNKHIGILPMWAATFVASGDVRPWRSTIANGLAAGAWPIHYRDESSNEPLEFGDYPNICVKPGVGDPEPPAGSGGVNTNEALPADPDIAHQPSLAFVPWLMTGRWYFLDEQMFWASWNHMMITPSAEKRNGADGVLISDQPRACGWVLRTHAQVLASLPADHPCLDDYQHVWESNMTRYEARYVTGTEASGAWQNAIGWLHSQSESGNSLYYDSTSSGYWWDANWQQATITMALAIGWDMKVPQSAPSKLSHEAVLMHSYKLFVGQAGDGSAGTFNYRRTVSRIPIGTDNVGLPVDSYMANWGDIYAVVESLGATGDSGFSALPAGTGMYYFDTPFEAGHWATNSGTAFCYAALAYAAEHGATGAAAALARIEGSSSWALADDGFEATPIFGIYPRTA